MNIAEVIAHLESIAPPSLQESYDNAGLLTGSRETEVTGILVCLDSTEKVIEEAIALGCNLVIAHHPIIFGGLKKLTGSTYVERTVIMAIRNNIAIYAIHTNLDNIFGGVNLRIAEQLELTNCRVLSPKKGVLKKLVTFAPTHQAEQVRNALFDAGAGQVGHYDRCSFNLEGTGTFRGGAGTSPFVGVPGIDHQEPETRIEVIFPDWKEASILSALRASHPYEEVAYDIYRLDNAFQAAGAGMIGETRHAMDEFLFLRFVKSKMETGSIRHSPLLGKEVKKVAVCGGSGIFLLRDAIAAGADVFITSDCKYHQFFDADGRIVIADIGHYESEQFTIPLLGSFLQEKFTTFAVHFSKIITNPVNYL